MSTFLTAMLALVLILAIFVMAVFAFMLIMDMIEDERRSRWEENRDSEKVKAN